MKTNTKISQLEYKGSERPLDTWVPTLLWQDVGYFEETTNAAEGGNIEVIPGAGPNGVVITGSISDGIANFIAAQGVQTIPGQDEILRVGTGWLYIGHVDEVVSLFDNSAYIADIDSTLAILEDMNEVCTGTVQSSQCTYPNPLANYGATSEVSEYKQGTGSAGFGGSADMTIADGDLSSDFPLKSGTTNTDISVCLWYRASSLPTSGYFHTLFSKYDPTDNKRSFWLSAYNNAGSTYIEFTQGHTNGAGYEYCRHATPILSGRWYHIGVTYDDSAKSCRIRIWDDNAGALHGSDATHTFVNDISVEDVDVCLGARNGDWCMSGYLDELVVFNHALSQGGIDSVRSGSYDFESDSGCVARWEFEPGSLTKDSAHTPSLTSTQKLQYNGADLDPDDWIDGFVEITSGTGVSQIRQISGVTSDVSSTTVSVTRSWDDATPPDGTSQFELSPRSAYMPMFSVGQSECGVATGGTIWTNRLVDSTKSWNGEYNPRSVQGGPYYSYIMVVEGAGAGSQLPILTSQGNVITTVGNFSEALDDTSRYVIVEGTKTWGRYFPYVEAQDSYYIANPGYYDMDYGHACTVVRYFLQNCAANHNDIQNNYLTPLRTTLSSYAGTLTKVPVIYTYTTTPANGVISWMADMVNLLNAGANVIPEPFVSPDDDFNNEFKTLGGTYLDDWYFYHTGSGEIHCGTNAKRDPGDLEQWWDN